MERKLNAIHKSKSRSQPDLYKVGVDGKVIHTGLRNKSIDDELFEMCALSGVRMDNDIFKIIIDLLRLNVNPNTLLEVLRKISNQRVMRSSKSSDNISRVGKSNSDRTANYAVFLDGGTKNVNMI